MKKYKIPENCKQIEINEQGIPFCYYGKLIKDENEKWKVIYITFSLEEIKE